MLPIDQLVERFFRAVNDGDAHAIAGLMTDDGTIDWSRSIGVERGVYDVPTGTRRILGGFREVWGNYTVVVDGWRQLAPNAVVAATHVDARGVTSGAEVSSAGAQLWLLRDGLIERAELHQSEDAAVRSWRTERVGAARLYFVCDARPHGREPRPLLDAALRGGADLLQLRDKKLEEEELVAAAAPFRDVAQKHGALFILNDRPDLVEPCGADGVHVGQEDMPVADARRLAGPAAVVGLSTHAPAQIDAAMAAAADDRPDQISVGPVWETPTKAGRPAAGLELVRYAARHAAGASWFAIGGIDTSNVGEVVAAGAERIVVVRAIRDAADPETAARELRDALAQEAVPADA